MLNDYPFFLSRNSKKVSRNTWHNRKLLRRAKLFSDAMETDLRDFDLKGNWFDENLIKEQLRSKNYYFRSNSAFH